MRPVMAGPTSSTSNWKPTYGGDVTATNTTIFQNYIEVWHGLLIFQWKREPPLYCPAGKVCYGEPAYGTNDPFTAGIEAVLDAHYDNLNFTDKIDYRWFDFDKDPVDEIIHLMQNNWLNKNTSSVFVLMMLYNPSLLTTTSVSVNVEWDLGGLTVTNCVITSFTSVLTTLQGSTPMFVIQVISFVGIFVLLCYEGYKTGRHCIDGIKPRRYYSQVSMVLGVFISGVVTIAIIVEWILLLTTQKFSGDLPLEGSVTLPVYLSTITGFRSIYSFLMSYRLLITINVIIFTARLLSLLSYYDAFSLINVTLEEAFWPTITVLLYVIISLLAVAAITTINFGADTAYFSEFGSSLLTLVRFLSMGDYAFEEIESTQVNETLYLVFYICFVIYGVCILLNMFIAIIYEAFDASQLKQISLHENRSQLKRTFNIVRYWLWPWRVMSMLNQPEKTAKFSKSDLETRSLPEDTIKKVLQIYGSKFEEENTDSEMYESNKQSTTFF
jgi:hypothetical protein